MNELNDFNDDDLRRVLPTLDRIEPAPPELVERLWAELAPLLDDGASGKLATLTPRTPPRVARRHWTMFLAAAAVLAVFAAGVSMLSSRDEPTPPSDSAVADLPSAVTDPPTVPASTAVTIPAPATAEAACEAFRRTIAEPVPFDTLGSSADDVEALTTWVSGLSALLADIDRVGRPSDSAEQYLSIQLLRTALRTAIDDVETGNDADAATAFANAQRHLDSIQLGESPLTGCVPAVEG